MSRPAGALALVLAVAAGTGAVAQDVRGAPQQRIVPAATQSVPVTSAIAACPAASGAAATVAALSVGAGTGSLAVGSSGREESQTGQAEQTQAQARTGGADRLLLAPAGTTPVVARAGGQLAAGLAAAQLGRGHGLGLASCPAPGTSAWFVGGGAGVGRTTVLTLIALDDAGAQVDLEVWGPDGRLASDALSGVSVPPRGEQDIRLDALVPADRYAVHVRATTGRVSALLRTTEVQGLQQLGWDWVPPADPPARHLLVPGTSGTGSRTLRLAAPGTAGAVVSVSLLGKSGTTRPDGLAAVAVPAGSVLDVALPGGDGAAAYVLDSTAPVTAGVLTRAGAAPGDGTAPGELAWSAAAPALDAGDQAVLPYVPTGAGQTTDLLLGAPGTSGDVRVTPLSASGATAAPRTVSVANGHAVLVPLGTAGTAARPYAVLVQVLPGSGPVTVAATLHETAPGGQPLTGVTTLPLRATVSHVVVPRVSEAPGMRLSR